jgi:hypothetical protein
VGRPTPTIGAPPKVAPGVPKALLPVPVPVPVPVPLVPPGDDVPALPLLEGEPKGDDPDELDEPKGDDPDELDDPKDDDPDDPKDDDPDDPKPDEPDEPKDEDPDEPKGEDPVDPEDEPKGLAPGLLPGVPPIGVPTCAEGCPKKPVDATCASPTWIKRQSSLPVIGSR